MVTPLIPSVRVATPTNCPWLLCNSALAISAFAWPKDTALQNNATAAVNIAALTDLSSPVNETTTRAAPTQIFGVDEFG